MEPNDSLQIAEALGNLAVQMQAHSNPEDTLRTFVTAAVEILPGVSWAGISLIRNNTITPSSPTDEVAKALDVLQSELGEGPVLEALKNQSTVVIPDLTVETRWPRFVAAAIDRGVRCMASFRLFVQNETLGAFTIYGPEPDLFDDDAVLYGEILAQHVAVAMAGVQAQAQLQQAIASRDLIGQAKGILMERFHVSAVRAFEMLAQLSQEANIKLVDVAQRVIDTTDSDT